MIGFNKYGKPFFKGANEIERLITSNLGCIVSDRITVDGCKVGYMYREEPHFGYPDSGWRILAGDEDEDYMNESKNHNVYSLNTICNYDKDIIPYLDAEIGKAYIRNSFGILVLDE